MWIEELKVDGFRRLAGSFRFGPSLTVVVGDNESGKSTLHDSLVRALYGFSATERRRRQGVSEVSRRAPWDGRPHRVLAKLRHDDRTYRVAWNFAHEQPEMTDEMGRDVLDDVCPRGEAPGEAFVGIGLDDFRQVCCLDQDALLAVRQSPSLGVALQEAVANVSGDVPVEHARALLDDFLRTGIGARIDSLRPSPTGRLQKAMNGRERLREELTAADEARSEAALLAAEHRRAAEARDGLLRALEEARRRQLLQLHAEADDRVRRARELERFAAAIPEAGQALPDAMTATVAAARERLDELHGRIESVERGVDAERVGLEALEDRERALVAAVDGLSAYADVDASARATVERVWAQLDELETETEADAAEPPARDPLLDRYRNERDELAALDQPAPPRWQRVLWIALVVVTLGLAWLVRAAIRRSRGAVDDILGERLAPYGAQSLAELDARVDDEERLVAQSDAVRQALRKRSREREERRSELLGQLQAALDAVSWPAAEIERRVHGYLTAVERHGEREAKEAELGRLRDKLRAATRPREELRRLAGERREVEERLRTALEEIGVRAEKLPDGLAEYERRLAVSRRIRDAVRRAEEASGKLDTLLAGETLESLDDAAREAREAVTRHRAAHPDLDETRLGLEDADDLADQARRQAEAVAALEQRIANAEAQAGEPAVLKERIAELDAEIERLEEAKHAIGLARTVLDEAAGELRREFAPHLNRALERNLARMTGGRYAEAVVDKNLDVSVVVPETGRLERADELSRATKDQLFLLQRLEIARLLAPTRGTAPLLLDDPFAHYDRHRLRYGLELVAEAANERQIVLFSEDRELIDLAQEACARCEVIQLQPPEPRAVNSTEAS